MSLLFYRLKFIKKIFFQIKKKKINFLPPKKTKIIIYDSNLSNYLICLIKNTNYQILFTRGESINIFILIKTLLKFKFTFLDYCNEYLSYVKPKFVITFTDNDKRFYLLKLNSGKKIFIQNAWRSFLLTDLGNLKYNSNFKVDFMLVFNDYIGKLYSSIITGKSYSIGSFRSNSNSITNSEKKYEILYISTFRNISNNTEITKNLKFNFFIKKDIEILKILKKFCQIHKKKIYIYGKYTEKMDQMIEYNFFKKIMGNYFQFIKNDKKKTYQYIDKSKIVLGSDSTLTYESLSRGNKTLFFNTRFKKNGTSLSKKFGWPKKNKGKIIFLINNLNYNDFEKVFFKIYFMSFNKWKNKVRVLMNDILKYDLFNKSCVMLLKKIGFNE